jgi:NADH dehydrogenase [ubiquinone] 1 alpha subcomplex assembly factor 7
VTLMAKASPDVSEDISSALKRLVGAGRSGMGALFKVLGVSSPDIRALPGLSDEQPRTS